MDCHTMGWEPIKMNTLVQSIVITSPLGFCISLITQSRLPVVSVSTTPLNPAKFAPTGI
jgi:hypothetical protein